ncbi:hypothetical protein [Paraburkholderia sp. RL17-337-BIB-A]|uniref:hypothetical protein n=1 Tax=Paraburkholderia sp. RL17-337-BIB-A TaxID=3031636 RepID=UPI0038BA2B52
MIRSRGAVAGIALKAGVNANQLRRLIRQYQEKHNGAAAIDGIKIAAAAFVLIVEIQGVGAKPEPWQRRRGLGIKLAEPFPRG